MNQLKEKQTDNHLNQNANSTNLTGQHQRQGRLTAILPTPFRLKAYNYVYWLAACDHGDLELKEFISQNIEAIAAESQAAIDELTELISSVGLDDPALPKLYVENTKKRNSRRKVFRISATNEIKKIHEILNSKPHPGNNSFARIDDTGSIETTVQTKTYKGIKVEKEGFKLCLINSAGFMNETTASCGCLKAKSDSYLIVKPFRPTPKRSALGSSASLSPLDDKKILVSLNEISGISGVNQTTIKNRIANDPHLTLREAIKGNSNRHTNSKTKAYAKAKAISRFARETRKTLDEISVYSRLTPQEKFVIYCRLFKDDKLSMQQIADTEYMSCSREWIRQVEDEGLQKICNAYHLDFAVT